MEDPRRRAESSVWIIAVRGDSELNHHQQFEQCCAVANISANDGELVSHRRMLLAQLVKAQAYLFEVFNLVQECFYRHCFLICDFGMS